MKIVSPCNPAPDEEPPTACLPNGGNPPTDCTLGDWAAWTPCSTTCGPGEHSRVRSHVDATNGGKPCEGSTEEVGPCQVSPCPLDEGVVPCEWSDWAEWSPCSRSCNGEQHRVRSIQQYALNSPMECVASSAAETRGCDDGCPAKTCCEWSEWSSWGACSSTCGPSFQQKTRDLVSAQCDAPLDDSISELYQRHGSTLTKDIEAQRMRDVGIAFVSGMLSLSACLLVVRLFRTRGGRSSMTQYQAFTAVDGSPRISSSAGLE